MRNKALLIILSIVFTISLIFTSLELPLLLDNQIQDSFNFLSFDQQSDELSISKTMLYFEHYHLKEIGYVSLFLIILLIFLGFYFNKKSLSLLGAFAVFLPVFGHFALSMFFLAGLGFLRIIWIPFTEISPYFMSYGNIIYLPNDILLLIGRLFGVTLNKEIAVCFIIIGILLFTMGVYIWFSTKFLKDNIAKSFIYKISRHPQYLGWILWSYGLFLLPSEAETMKNSWGYPDSLPWLLASMTIIAVSLLEEISMRNKFGNEYEDFKRNTAFMFPLPNWLKKFIKHPLRIFFNTSDFSKKRHILVFTSYYTILFIFISFIIFSFTEPRVDNPFLRNEKQKVIINKIEQLEKGTSRRQKDLAAMELESYGNLSVPYLQKTLKNSDETTKSLTLRTLRNINDSSVCKDLTMACITSSELVLEEAILSIGALKCKNSKNILLENINHPNQKIKDASAFAIGKTGLKDAIPILLKQFDSLGKYSKITYIETFGNLKSSESLELLHTQLKSTDRHIVEASIIALSKIGSESSIPHLKRISLSDVWEIDLYAQEAIKMIKKNN